MPPPGPNVDVLLAATQPSCIWSLDQMTELDFHRDPSILSMVVDAMADGVFTVDANGHFVAWSAGAERITGYTSDEVVGKPCRILEGPNCKGFSTLGV